MSELASQLREYNDWRRGALISQPDPVELGQAIDAAIVAIQQRDYLDNIFRLAWTATASNGSACASFGWHHDRSPPYPPIRALPGVTIDDLKGGA